MRTAGSFAAVVALLAVAGCGAVQVPAAGRPAPRQQATLTTVTNAGNRALASRQARRLLALLAVPPGAVKLGRAPSSLSSPVMGTPAVSSLIDLTESWRVRMPFRQLQSWLAAHYPRGLKRDGWTTGTGPVAGDSYAGPANPAWQSADLEVGEAAGPHGTSVLRADGVVVWLDPVPVPDNAPGPRMRVTVAAGCPATDAGFAGVTNYGRDLRHRLLPAATPTKGLACWYIVSTSRLHRQQHLDRAAAVAMARSLARLPVSHPIGALYHCTLGDDELQIVALSYRGRPDVDVWVVSLSGCGGAANGFIRAGRTL